MKKFDKINPVELSENKNFNFVNKRKSRLREQCFGNRSHTLVSEPDEKKHGFTNLFITRSKAEIPLIDRNISRNMNEYSFDRVEQVESMASDYLKFPFLNSLYAIAICNINTESNIHLILKAFVKIKNRRIVIIGNWHETMYGRYLKKKYAKYENIIMLDQITEPRVLNLLIGNALIYIQSNNLRGSDSCLFEAMSHSVPVLAYKTTYNFIATGYQASYFLSTKNIIYFLIYSTMESLKKNSISMKEISDSNSILCSIA